MLQRLVIEHDGVTKLLTAMRAIRVELEAGTLRGPAIDRALQRLPLLDADTREFLWSPLGASERRKIHDEQHRLAMLAPHGRIYPHRTMAEADAHWLLCEHLYARDYSSARTLAGGLVRRFPQSDLVSWYKTIASGDF